MGIQDVRPADRAKRVEASAGEFVSCEGRVPGKVVPPVGGMYREDSYHEPLQRLDMGGARVYLGLLHLHDVVEGAVKRIDVARKFLPAFGVATQCGWARRPPNEEIEDLLQLHRAVADHAPWPTAVS